MQKPKLKSKEETRVLRYGRIIIDTRIGELEYSYQTGGDYTGFDDPDYQLERGSENGLTDDELGEIDDIIAEEIYK